MAKVRPAIPRGLFTKQFKLDCEAASGFPMGLMSFPKDLHGWGTVDANKPGAVFIPYGIVYVGAGQNEDQSIGGDGTIWNLAYRVTIAGVDGEQTEDVADHLRSTLMGRPRLTLENQRDSTSWKLLEYRCTAIGDLNVIGAPQPDYFVQTDSYSVRVSKG